jgi:hypothetical protein
MLALCGVLGDTSSYVHDWLTEQPAAKEESLTDWLLFDISKKSPVVRYQLFNRHEEGRTTGADWEWWFVSNSQNLRLRVQAKKAQGKKDLYSDLARTNKCGLQIDKLMRDAQAQNAIPLYAFFSSENSQTKCGERSGRQGIYLASAKKVHDKFVATRVKVSAQDVLKLSKPLQCVACCPLSWGNAVPIDYFRNYFPEEFSGEGVSNDNIGIHEQIPNYVRKLLSRDSIRFEPEAASSEMPNEFDALLVFDLRT